MFSAPKSIAPILALAVIGAALGCHRSFNGGLLISYAGTHAGDNGVDAIGHLASQHTECPPGYSCTYGSAASVTKETLFSLRPISAFGDLTLNIDGVNTINVHGDIDAAVISRDGNLIAYMVLPNVGYSSTEVHLFNRRTGEDSVIASTAEPRTWLAYPKWTVGPSNLIWIQSTAGPHAIQNRLEYWGHDNVQRDLVTSVGQLVSATWSHNGREHFAVWNAQGLTDINGRQQHLCLAASWLGTRTILGNALTYSLDDRGLFFGLRSSSGDAEVYYYDISTGRLASVWHRRSTVITGLEAAP